MILISRLEGDDIDIMPATDVRFVLRVPVELYRELEKVKAAGGGSINLQILRRLGYGGEESAISGKEAGDRDTGRSGTSVDGRDRKGGKGGRGSAGGATGKAGLRGKAAGGGHKAVGVLSWEEWGKLSKSEQMKAVREGRGPGR